MSKKFELPDSKVRPQTTVEFENVGKIKMGFYTIIEIKQQSWGKK